MLRCSRSGPALALAAAAARSRIRLTSPASSLAVPLLDFTDLGHGWLVLGSTSWHTADGGRTWTRG
jgi:hypothetical protein